MVCSSMQQQWAGLHAIIYTGCYGVVGVVRIIGEEGMMGGVQPYEEEEEEVEDGNLKI